MSEELEFHFEGALADRNEMNFYEAARFQYAASRLLVKLAQFRAEGSFVKKITNSSNYNILLESHSPGSFNIRTKAPTPTAGDKKFLDLSLSELLSYISERLIEKGDEDELLSAISSHQALLSASKSESPESVDDVDAIVDKISANPDLKKFISKDQLELVERRIAELSRERILDEQKSEIAKIDAVREQKLIAMSAPLLSEMATALRRSANSLEVKTNINSQTATVLYLDKAVAAEIETAKVDREITPILCDITQYNKETGWGKVRFSNMDAVISFSIPSDIRKRIQPTLIDQMKKDKVYLQSYIVRDRAGDPIRLIIVGILETPKD
ncbi:hypothetical protein [Sphingomonas pituitosa]|uniref:hypothetical protein n=1 Tax=Sphingomonas pituitosa TaxID=99597 RepID=UPI000A077BDB|nr:hypothetical protein [Sphingomonas pituitosa]